MTAPAPAVAWPTLRGFARRRGRAAVELALHAAVPLGLTPELLHLIRVNFVDRAHFMAEADVLLSDLVRDLGGGYYQLEPAIRELLLRQLRTHPDGDGEERLLRVADFLYGFCKARLHGPVDAQEREFLQAQQWTALSYVEPAAAAELLAAALNDGVRSGDGGEIRRIAALSHRLAAPLAGAGRVVVRYAARFERLLDGDAEAAATPLGDAPGERTVGAVELPAPAEVAGMVAGDLIAATDLSVDGQPLGDAAEAPVAAPAPEAREDRAAPVAEREVDVYISYAHLDDEPLVEGEPGWVSQLHRTLEVRLGQILGRKPRIWRDPELHGGDAFPDALVEVLSRSAALVAVVSPLYLASDWCGRELEEFLRAAGGAETGRLFKVVKMQVPVERQPAELQNMLGYDFYRIDPETGRQLDFADPEPESRSRWLQRIDDLAQDLRRVLVRLDSGRDEAAESAEEPVSQAPEMEPGLIYLSHAREDHAAAAAIGDALFDAGLEVFVGGGENWEQLDAIEECTLFMPLISRHTAERQEEFFREWRQAFRRSRKYPGERFIVPVAIDDIEPSALPEELARRQWIRAPDGKLDRKAIADVKELARRLAVAAFAKHQSKEAVAAREQLPPEVQLVILNVIDELCEDPYRFPDRTRTVTSDGKVKIYSHPDPPVEITYEIDAEERELYFVNYAALKERSQLFLSYSHEDRKWRDRLYRWLAPLEKEGALELLDTAAIASSEDFDLRKATQKALASATVAILLVSQDYLESPYIRHEQLEPLLERAETEGLRILWIAVGASDFEKTPLARFQGLNDPSKPLDSLPRKKLDKELERITRTIQEVLEA